MALQSEHNNSIRRYLLGELSEREREQIEDLLMTDKDVYQELLFAEDDLIDDYVLNTLHESDRTKFKKRFLAVPELRQNVSITSALRRHALATTPQVVDEPQSRSVSLVDRLRSFFMQPAVAVSFAAILLAAVVLDAWLLRQNSQLRGRVEQLEARQTNPSTAHLEEQLAAADQRNKQLSDELSQQQQRLAEESRKLALAQEQLNRQSPRANGSGVLAIALTLGSMRDSGEWTKFSIRPSIGEVSFGLDVADGNYLRYQAVLETVEGQPKLSKNLRLTRSNVLTLNVLSRILVPGDYRIVLNGINSSGASTEVGNYYFRVLNSSSVPPK